MKDVFKSFNSGRTNFFLVAFIAVVLAGAVLKIIAPVLLPITIGLLLAFVMYPLVMGMDKLHIPRVFSILLVVLIIVSGLYLFAVVLISSGRAILSQYPKYENRLTEIYLWAAKFLDLSYDEDLSFFQNLWGQLGIRTMIRTYTFSFSNLFIGFLKDAVMVVLFMVFLLVEAANFKEKLEYAFESKRSGQIKRIGADVMRQVTQYLTAKFFISLVTGIVIALGLSLTGLEFAIVWGLIQFILNFIPTLGSIAVGIAVVLFSILQFWPDPGPIVVVILVMLGTNMILGNILDPKIIGDRVGLSALVVLISLVIWGWLWGFVGMILAVPMTVIIKILCENVPVLESVSIMLSSRKSVLARKAEEVLAAPLDLQSDSLSGEDPV